MRVLCLNHNLREHGTYFRALHMARELVRLGHECTLYTASPEHWYRPPAPTDVDGVRVIETPSWTFGVGADDGWGPIDVAYRMWRALIERCDLVYAFAHPPNVYLPARLAQVLRRKTLVVDWCDAYRDGILPIREALRRETRREPTLRQRWAEAVEVGRLERGIVRAANGVTVISQGLSEETAALGVDPESILRLPSGAPADAIEPQDKAACRRALGVDAPGSLAGYVANYHPDVDFFLEALAEAFREHPDARLLMAGPPMEPDVVERHGMSGRIVELGKRPFTEMSTVLGASDILALPLADTAHNRYRWPNKFGDYLAAGRPIATNIVGDVAEYVTRAREDENPIGTASPCGDAVAYGRDIASLLAASGDWEAMGAASRELAEGKLNWENLGRQLDAFLQWCVATKRKDGSR